jgi:hypothetical protein
MLHHIKKLLGIKPKVVEAPYKVEISSVAEQATQAVVESIAKPAKKKPAAKKAPSAKKPRAPKKPKAD